MSDLPLDAAGAAELRRLVGEVLAELLPDLRGSGRRAPAGQVPSWPGVAPAEALAAGGVPSGVPAGTPSPTPATSTTPPNLMNGPSITVSPAERSIHQKSGARADRLGAGERAAYEKSGGRADREGVGGASGHQGARWTAEHRGAGWAAGLPGALEQPGPPAGEPSVQAGFGSWEVRVETDADLRDFALRVLRLADNPKLRRDLIAGRIRFRLGGTAAPDGAAARPAHRVERGAVTERAVAAAAAAGAGLVLGPGAVLTPLAKDKARALGVPIDKER